MAPSEPPGPAAEAFRTLELSTARGPLVLRRYGALPARGGLVVGGGVGGGFDTPARGLYPWLGQQLAPLGVCTLHVRYRYPTEFEEAVHDVQAAVGHLVAGGVRRVGLVGHSFGGAVMIAAALRVPEVVTVVGLASQSHGTAGVGQLAPRSLLLLHGTRDTILPPACSQFICERARGRCELQLLEGAGHVLDEAAPRVRTRVRDWLVREVLEEAPGA